MTLPIKATQYTVVYPCFRIGKTTRWKTFVRTCFLIYRFKLSIYHLKMIQYSDMISVIRESEHVIAEKKSKV